MKRALKATLPLYASLAVFVSEAWAAGDKHATPHEEAGHAGHAAEHSSAGLPQLDPEWFASQIFWLVVIFASLYVIFARKILPELSSIIENRRESIQENLDTAQDLKEEAEKVQHAYEEILGEAREGSSRLFEEMEQKIKSKSAEEMNAHRNRSNEEIQKAEQTIQNSKEEAMEEMNNIAAEIASLAAEKIVGISTDIDQAKNVVQNISKKAA